MIKRIFHVCILLWLTIGSTTAQEVHYTDTLRLPTNANVSRYPVQNNSSANWNIGLVEDVGWLRVEKTQAENFQLSVAANESAEKRTAVIRIWDENKEVRIPVSQQGAQEVTAEFNVAHTAGSNWFPVPAGLAADWNISINSEAAYWAIAKRHGDNAIMVYVTANPTREQRMMLLTLSDGKGQQMHYRVTQDYEHMPLSHREYSLTDEACTLALTVGTTEPLDFRLPAWISLHSSTPEADGNNIRYEFRAEANPTDRTRRDSICIDGSGADMQAVVPVWQYPHTSYHPIGAEELADTPVQPCDGEASSFQPGQEFALSFDGAPTTHYHSAWDNSPDNYFPITLTYRFKHPEDIDYVAYHPRTDGGTNGMFGEVEVWVQTAKDTGFRHLLTTDLQGQAALGRIEFPDTQRSLKAVRLIVNSGTGERKGFACCSEMEFYRKTHVPSSCTELFTDASCSRLKSGISKRQIRHCRSPFFRNLALSMLEGTYPREFRIAAFRAWPHPDKQGEANSNMPFSLLDNPTGMAAVTGEPLVIMADRSAPGLGIRIQNLSAPTGSDGYGGEAYPLHEGVNVIRPQTDGLIYVMYHADEADAAPGVVLHFATGRVNGFFDSARHTRSDGTSRYQELLARAGDKYFDVLSPNVHLTFRSDDFRRLVPDAQRLLAAYDTLLLHEQEFEGMLKYDRQLKNRMYIHTSYSGYLFATHHHIGFDETLLPELLNVARLKTTHCWGPAHELGHMLQVSPYLKWTAMTEVTNNILALEIQRLWGSPSRLHTEPMRPDMYADIYEEAINGAFVEKRAHTELADWFDKLVPFWQLRLYLMEVAGKEDFYKDVFEASRRLKTERPGLTNGQLQLEFVYNSCQAAGIDLRPFFERWGWLRPVERIYDDYYGKDTLRVTADEVTALNARIDGLGLPRLTAAAEYITDNTLHLYKHPEPFQPGTARIDLQTGMVVVSGGQGTAAYEARRGKEVVFVSARTEFTVPAFCGAPVDELTVIAVAPDGQRQPCTHP